MVVDINWWSEPPSFEPSYEIRLDLLFGSDMNYDDIYEIFDWLRENIKGKYIDRKYEREGLVGLSFFFNEQEDAMAFKMRWT